MVRWSEATYESMNIPGVKLNGEQIALALF